MTPSLAYSQGAVNFSLFSSSARAVSLCLFTEADLQRGQITSEIQLDPESNRSGDVWHLLLPALPSGLLYGAKGNHNVPVDA